jgi:hypothetical protein
VTLPSVVTDRYARWAETLTKYGYLIEPHPRLETSPRAGIVALRGRRRPDLGAPEVVIDIAESWRAGADPDGLGLDQHGCHVAGSGWHAQLESGDEGAERLDVDRFKPRNLSIHRHPFGSPNEERIPAADLPAPEAWVNHVETISAEQYFS